MCSLQLRHVATSNVPPQSVQSVPTSQSCAAPELPSSQKPSLAKSHVLEQSMPSACEQKCELGSSQPHEVDGVEYGETVTSVDVSSVRFGMVSQPTGTYGGGGGEGGGTNGGGVQGGGGLGGGGEGGGLGGGGKGGGLGGGGEGGGGGVGGEGGGGAQRDEDPANRMSAPAAQLSVPLYATEIDASM